MRAEKTWKQFAEMIGLDHVYLNKIYNGRRNAGEKTIAALAEYFKDPRFYDVAGLDRPDPFLAFIRRNWGSVPLEERQQLVASVAKHTSDKMPRDKPDK